MRSGMSEWWCERMDDHVTQTRNLVASGATANDVRAWLAGNEVVRVRRGAYRPAGVLSAEAEHRLLIGATLPLLTPGAVVSHASAAVLHGVPATRTLLGRVHITRDRRGGRRTRYLHDGGQPLPESHVEVHAVSTVTSLRRTAIDLARTLPFDWGLAAVDHVLARGVRVEELEGMLAELPRAVGNPQAQALLRLADPRSESVGESRSRAIFVRAGLPEPLLQFEVRRDGFLIGRSDFAWRQSWVLGEFDGLIKYGRLVRPGESAPDVLVREKVREDAMRAEGWRMVRWIWADLDQPASLVSRLQRALASRR